MKKITPNIALEDCEHSVEFYQNVFGGRISGGSRTPDGKLLHLELQVNPDCVLYFNDVFDGTPTEGGNISIVLEMDSMEETERLYDELQKGGGVHYELQKTFWGAYHAVILDRHGVRWSLNYTLT